MPTREARLKSEARKAEAKINPAIAAVLRKQRARARKGLATKAAKRAVLAEPGIKAAADAAEHALLDKIQALPPNPAATRLKALQDRAAGARAALAAARANGTLRKRAKMNKPDPHADSLAGRIDRKLMEIGKTRAQLQDQIGVSRTVLASLARRPAGEQRMRPENVRKVADILGVTEVWLLHGDGVDAVADNQPDRSGGEPAQLVPHKSTVFKANGKHPRSHEARVEHAMTQNVDSAITSLWSLLPMDAKVMVIARVAELIAMQTKQQR